MLGSFFRKPHRVFGNLPQQTPLAVMSQGPIAPTEQGGDFVGASMPSGSLFGSIGDPYAAPQLNTGVGKIRLGFNAPGGWGEKINDVGDILLNYAGDSSGLEMTQQRRRDARQDAMLQMQMDKEERAARRRQIQNLGNGGIASVDPETGAVEVVRQPDAPQPGEQERLFHMWEGETDPVKKNQLGLMLRGAQYSAPVMETRQQNAIDLADHRYGNSVALKGVPTYAQTHPKAGSSGGGKVQATRVLNGKVYRKINGRWFTGD